MIDPEEFDVTLRKLTRGPKFVPFVVELDDGQRLMIRHPGVAFGGGGAALIDLEEGFIDFTHKEVKAFREFVQEVVA